MRQHEYVIVAEKSGPNYRRAVFQVSHGLELYGSDGRMTHVWEDVPVVFEA